MIIYYNRLFKHKDLTKKDWKKLEENLLQEFSCSKYNQVRYDRYNEIIGFNETHEIGYDLGSEKTVRIFIQTKNRRDFEKDEVEHIHFKFRRIGINFQKKLAPLG